MRDSRLHRRQVGRPRASRRSVPAGVQGLRQRRNRRDRAVWRACGPEGPGQAVGPPRGDRRPAARGQQRNRPHQVGDPRAAGRLQRPPPYRLRQRDSARSQRDRRELRGAQAGAAGRRPPLLVADRHRVHQPPDRAVPRPGIRPGGRGSRGCRQHQGRARGRRRIQAGARQACRLSPWQCRGRGRWLRRGRDVPGKRPSRAAAVHPRRRVPWRRGVGHDHRGRADLRAAGRSAPTGAAVPRPVRRGRGRQGPLRALPAEGDQRPAGDGNRRHARPGLVRLGRRNDGRGCADPGRRRENRPRRPDRDGHESARRDGGPDVDRVAGPHTGGGRELLRIQVPRPDHRRTHPGRVGLPVGRDGGHSGRDERGRREGRAGRSRCATTPGRRRPGSPRAPC